MYFSNVGMSFFVVISFADMHCLLFVGDVPRPLFVFVFSCLLLVLCHTRTVGTPNSALLEALDGNKKRENDACATWAIITTKAFAQQARHAAIATSALQSCRKHAKTADLKETKNAKTFQQVEAHANMIPQH